MDIAEIYLFIRLQIKNKLTLSLYIIFLQYISNFLIKKNSAFLLLSNLSLMKKNESPGDGDRASVRSARDQQDTRVWLRLNQKFQPLV